MITPPRLAVLLTLVAAVSVRADTITLKRSVRIDPGTPVTLADVADLDGAHALKLAGTVVAAETDSLTRQNPGGEPARWTLALGDVRDAIETQGDVNWAFLTVRGRDVTLLAPDHRPPPVATPENDPDTTPPRPEGITRFDEGSVGRFARGVVRSILRTEDDDLRIVWPARDAAFLRLPVASQTVHVQPIGSSARMPLKITIYDGDRIVRTETVRADITVRRRVHTVTRPLNRATPIGAGDTTARDAWVGPGVNPAAAVAGQVTARRLEPGTIIETDDITPPLVVERGELITLHCISGAVAIKTPARALADARDGETVPVEMEGTGRRVLARMSGRGTAVLVVRPNTPERPAPRGGARP